MSELFVPTVNFLMLVALLAYFAWPLFKKSVADRRESIKKFSDEARLQKLDAEKKYREFESKLKSFETEAQALLQGAEDDAAALRLKILTDAKKSAEWIIKDSESTAVANFSEFKEELRKMVINTAVIEAEKLIKQHLSKDEHSKIIQNYVEKVQ